MTSSRTDEPTPGADIVWSIPSAPSPKTDPQPAPRPAPQPRRAAEPQVGLDIRDRRQWKTWQLVAAALLTLLVGMAIGHSGGGTGSAGNKATFTLPGPAGSSTGGGGTSANATVSPATAGVAGSTVLVPRSQSTGPGTTSSFTVTAAGWTISWIFDCSAAPSGSAPFQIFVLPGGGSTPVVDEAARTASGITTQTNVGPQQLRIDTESGCAWAVKVTGVGHAGPA